MRREEYVPFAKPCPVCGVVFWGMEDVPTEICDECSGSRLDEEMPALVAESTVLSVPRKRQRWWALCGWLTRRRVSGS